MKIILILILQVFIFAQVNFGNDINKAIKQGKKEKKLIYVLVTDKYCIWCYRMKNTVLQNEKVQDALSTGYIPLILDKDNDNIPSEFSTIFFPTSMIIDPNDNNHVIAKLIGYTSYQALNKILHETYELYE